MVFQRDFTSQLAFVFVTFWLSTHCKLAEYGAYFEQGQRAFWILKAFKSNCKVSWRDL